MTAPQLTDCELSTLRSVIDRITCPHLLYAIVAYAQARRAQALHLQRPAAQPYDLSPTTACHLAWVDLESANRRTAQRGA